VIFEKVDAHMASFTIRMPVVMALTVSCTPSSSYIRLTSEFDTEAGEVCREWQTWGDHFHIQSIFGHSLLQATIYVVLAVCLYNGFHQSISSIFQITFAGSAAVLVVTYAPQ